MANSLEQDLEGKIVIFKQEALAVPAEENPFRVDGGFGASAETAGSALVGTFVLDGEQARMDGFDVERVVEHGDLPLLQWGAFLEKPVQVEARTLEDAKVAARIAFQELVAGRDWDVTVGLVEDAWLGDVDTDAE